MDTIEINIPITAELKTNFLPSEPMTRNYPGCQEIDTHTLKIEGHEIDLIDFHFPDDIWGDKDGNYALLAIPVELLNKLKGMAEKELIEEQVQRRYS